MRVLDMCYNIGLEIYSFFLPSVALASSCVKSEASKA